MRLKKAALFACWMGLSVLSSGQTTSCPTVDSIDILSGIPDLLEAEKNIRQKCPDERVVLSFVWHKLASAYSKSDQGLEKAYQMGHQALRLRDSLGQYEDLAKTRFNLGKVCIQIGLAEEAKEHLLEAERYFNSAGKTAPLIVVRTELGNLYESLGELGLASNLFRLNIQTASDPNVLVEALTEYGSNFLEQKLPEKALEYLRQAIPLFNRDSDPYNHGTCHLNIGVAYTQLGQPQKALEHYQQALQLFQQSELLENIALCYSNMGFLYVNMPGKEKKALEFLQKSRETAQKGQLVLEESRSLDNIGEYYFKTNSFPQALAYYHQAIARLIPDLPSDPLQAPTIEQLRRIPSKWKVALLGYLLDKGNAFLALHESAGDMQYLPAALLNYRQADLLIDLMRQEHSALDSKLFWRQGSRPVYEKALQACYLLQDIDQAFYFMEKSRAAILKDALAMQTNRTALSDSLLFLQNRIGIWQVAYVSDPDEPGILDSLVAAERRLEVFKNRNKTSWEQRLQIPDPDHNQWTPEHRELVIEYFYGTEHLYIWVKTHNMGAVLVQKPVSELTHTLNPYLNYLVQMGDNFSPDEYACLASDLYQVLLGDALGLTFFLYGQITIVPDGRIALVPFDALLPFPEFDADFFLLWLYEFQLAYSMEVLELQRAIEPREKGVLNVAPVFDYPTPRNFPELPSSRDLLKKLRFASPQNLTGEDATLEAFLAKAEGYDVINFFTHAEAGGAEMPFIAFADSVLFLPQIYSMDIPAAMINLWACQTALGKDQSGEGVMSLSWAFAGAGSASLISSLWQVRESATAQIVDRFYQYLRKGESRSTALWKAKQDYLNNNSKSAQNPYFWAAFVFTGADGAWDNRNSFPMISLGIGLLAVFILGGWLASRKSGYLK